MFLTNNSEVVWGLKWPSHSIINVSAIVNLASPQVNVPYARGSQACVMWNYRSAVVENTAHPPMEVLHRYIKKEYCSISGETWLDRERQ